MVTGKRLFSAILSFFWLVGHVADVAPHTQTMSSGSEQEQILILDAGHGGEDGGAVSPGGVPESRINLAIALRLDGILGLYGIRTLPLRETDISLHDEQAQTLRQKKRSDLQNRVARVNAVDRAVLLSIHQNSYPDGRYSGAQAFYAPTASSRDLAQTVQESLRLTLDPKNERLEKQIPETIYLMNHVSCPAVLVECGFLTNPREERLLQDAIYQTKLACALAGGYLQWST